MSRISSRYVPKNFVYYNDWSLLKLGFRWQVKHHRVKSYKKVNGVVQESLNPRGGYTQVTLKNPQNVWITTGTSVCDSDDIFVNKIGFYNALTDAFIKLIKTFYPTLIVTTPTFKIDKGKTVYKYIEMIKNDKSATASTN